MSSIPLKPILASLLGLSLVWLQPRPAAAGADGTTPDAERVFAVLAAEIAVQRGELVRAHHYYMQAAMLTRRPRLAELAVRSAIAADDDEAAWRALRLWLELAPTAEAAHQVAAFLSLRADDMAAALTHLRRLVELAGDGIAEAYAQVVSIVARAPDVETRLALMRALVEAFPESAEARQSLAMVAASAGRFELAATAARHALGLRPDWNKPRLFLVRLLLSEGRRTEARELIEDFVANSPDDAALRMLYGQLLVDDRDYGSAREVFARLLANQPKQPDVLFALGILSLQLDDLEAACGYFERLYATGQRRDEAAFYLGQAEERAGRDRQAASWYARVGDANHTDAQVRIALIEARGGDLARAREILQRLRDRAPEDAIALYMVEAEILAEVGQPGQAMAVYAAALEVYPEEPNLLYARALYAVERDRLELAERDLRQIIANDPEHADALNALGYTLADRTERYDEARGYIERAYALKPDEPAILDSMGWVHYRLGDYDTALEYLQRAFAALDDGEIAAHLGEVLWELGRHDEAQAVWARALEAHPGHAYLTDVIERYRSSRTAADDNQSQPRESQP
ncbi:tetratricopeptide repeat protein [Marichromatium bheemlicum]|uniref:Tetratricopeptide repeat protein n=1 Tax=Marichromatium bheemlicum TaxID=365339 RepID=A0ABX1I5H0_9GAMM|nr:tetratricopeptide repeat protein [Marichromatium bheemlicum]NKN32179.1 tetratricopeptide repeat protein [Marichromatium bheemlicum]